MKENRCSPAEYHSKTLLFTYLSKDLPVEVVHGVTGVAWDLVQTLSSAYRLLNGILIVLNFVIWHKSNKWRWLVSRLVAEPSWKPNIQALTFHSDVDTWGQKQASEAVVEDLVALQSGSGVVSDFNT